MIIGRSGALFDRSPSLPPHLVKIRLAVGARKRQLVQLGKESRMDFHEVIGVRFNGLPGFRQFHRNLKDLPHFRKFLGRQLLFHAPLNGHSNQENRYDEGESKDPEQERQGTRTPSTTLQRYPPRLRTPIDGAGNVARPVPRSGLARRSLKTEPTCDGARAVG